MSETDRRDRRDPGVSAEQLQAYLQSKQWYEDGKIRSVATIWHRQGDNDAEVVLPFSSVKDYWARLRDALSTIAAFEARDVAEVLNEVKRLFANVITVRVVHADTADGTIPINDGVLLIGKAKDLLSAAAQSIYSKKKQFLGKTSKETKDYLDTLLLGQTEIGSYVVNVFAPVQANAAVFQTKEGRPLGEAITQNLVTGLAALEQASVEYEEKGDIKVFDVAMLAGVSSNMCEALLGFSGEKHNRTFEVTVTAAAGPLFASEAKKFSFSEKDVEVLEKATGYYKDEYVLKEQTLWGHIRKLNRPKDETSGTVTMQAQVGDVERNVKIELTGDDYHQAVLAHDTSQLVRVSGDVHIKSKSAWLLHPSRFGILTDEDLLGEL